MRNVLSELPVFLCCLWGGVASGLAVFLLRLPRLLYTLSRRGRRSSPWLLALFAAADCIAALLMAAAFGLTLLHANGGEIRAYALCGFVLGAAGVCAAAHRLAGA